MLFDHPDTFYFHQDFQGLIKFLGFRYSSLQKILTDALPEVIYDE